MPNRDMLVNFVPGEECRIAILENGRLEEFYQERVSSESHVGNIYKGRVANVEPSIQAAFIEFGLERNGFLHISDLHPMYFPGDHKEETEMVGQKTPRRDRPPIQKCLRRGQDILVQVLKEGIGTKGPTLTSYLSIPGRYLVMMPHMEKLGVSRKVEDDEARREMRRVLAELKPPEGFGFIIRTAGMGRPKTDLKRDLAYLVRLWKVMDQRMKSDRSLGELYTESDLVIRTIRDVFSNDITRLIVDNPDAARRAHDFLSIASPRSASKVLLYKDPIPLFHRFDVERQIENINARIVPLPSGGSLVIDSTEALVAIDVNSGKNRDNRDAETTAYKTNVEAADEICRQLRLRDLGGVVVNDLIDMHSPKHRRDIEQRFRNNLKNDRARTRTQAISQFGILEMTRQRMRPSLAKSTYTSCSLCQGAGMVKSPETVVLEVMRRLTLAMQRQEIQRIELTVSPDVAFQLLNRKRIQLVDLEKASGKPVMVRVHSGHPPDLIELQCFDARGGIMPTIPPGPWPDPLIQPFEPLDINDPSTEDSAEDSDSLDSSLDLAGDADAASPQASAQQDQAGEFGESGGESADIQATAAGDWDESTAQPTQTSAPDSPKLVQAGEDEPDSESSSTAPADDPTQTAKTGRSRRRRRGRRGRGTHGDQNHPQDQAPPAPHASAPQGTATPAPRPPQAASEPTSHVPPITPPVPPVPPVTQAPPVTVVISQPPPIPHHHHTPHPPHQAAPSSPANAASLAADDASDHDDDDNVGNRIDSEHPAAGSSPAHTAGSTGVRPGTSPQQQGQVQGNGRRRRRRRGRGRGQGQGNVVGQGQAPQGQVSPGNNPSHPQPPRPPMAPKPPVQPANTRNPLPPRNTRNPLPPRNPGNPRNPRPPQQPRQPLPNQQPSGQRPLPPRTPTPGTPGMPPAPQQPRSPMPPQSRPPASGGPQPLPSRGYRNANQQSPARPSQPPKPRSEPS